MMISSTLVGILVSSIFGLFGCYLVVKFLFNCFTKNGTIWHRLIGDSNG